MEVGWRLIGAGVCVGSRWRLLMWVTPVRCGGRLVGKVLEVVRVVV